MSIHQQGSGQLFGSADRTCYPAERSHSADRILSSDDSLWLKYVPAPPHRATTCGSTKWLHQHHPEIHSVLCFPINYKARHASPYRFPFLPISSGCPVQPEDCHVTKQHDTPHEPARLSSSADDFPPSGLKHRYGLPHRSRNGASLSPAVLLLPSTIGHSSAPVQTSVQS